MKKPVVDYRKFRPSKLNDPEFSHLKLLFGWVGYFCLYFLTERLIDPNNCHLIHSKLDDMIPFCEWFVIPYVSWYLLIVASLLYFALYDIDAFKKLQTYIIITQVVAMAIYIIYPNRQPLRPDLDTLGRDNLLIRGVNILYEFDTDTNVFPSLHVGYSLGIASTWIRKRDASAWLKVLISVFVLVICASITFVKQHSILDAFGAIPVCLLAEYLTFYFFPKRKKATS